MKHKISLIRLGHIEHLVDFQKIINWKSKLFEIADISCLEHLPDSDVDDGFYDVKYSKHALKKMVQCPDNSNYAIAIMPNRFEDNFYLHRINEKCAVLSLYGINDILNSKNISIEHFIIKQLYEICAIKHYLGDSSSDDVYELVHLDTRGCLFDMNGERTDIIYNTEKPIICESCKSKFKGKQIGIKTISTLENELKRIKKPLILRVENAIKRYPLASIIISALMAVALNIVANYIWEWIKN